MFPWLPSPQKVCLTFLCLGATLAPAAQAPYTENFDSYPNGGVPANFVEATDPDWAISSNGTTGSYIGSIAVTGGQKSSSALISLDNVAGHNFTFRTTFTIRSVDDRFGGVGKFVDLGFTGPGYELVYKPVAGGTIYTNQFFLTGGVGGTYLAIGTKPCQVMIHGGYVGTDLYLTAEVSDGVDSRSLRTSVAGSTANNTKFGYTQAVGGSSFRTGAADVSYDDFSVLLETFPVKLGNLSTRVNVSTGGTGRDCGRYHYRPSLRGAGINQPLEDPTLELRGPYGTLAIANDNWGDSQKAEIANTSLAPSNDAEAAIIADLLPTNYTAIVRGKNDTTGVALVEIYHLN